VRGVDQGARTSDSDEHDGHGTAKYSLTVEVDNRPVQKYVAAFSPLGG
jgi:hypothetical protein